MKRGQGEIGRRGWVGEREDLQGVRQRHRLKSVPPGGVLVRASQGMLAWAVMLVKRYYDVVLDSNEESSTFE